MTGPSPDVAATVEAARVAHAQREAFLSSPNLDPAWVAGWHAAVDHMVATLAPPCPDCGPGYRYGDEGCRHAARAETRPHPAEPEQDDRLTDAEVRDREAQVYDYLIRALSPWRDYMAVEDVSAIADGVVEELGAPQPERAARDHGLQQVDDDVLAISRMLDGSYPADLDPEARLWRRVTKVAEEAGEVWSALAGYLGENPRKGSTHTRADLEAELFDVAAAGLGAVAHLRGNERGVIDDLATHVGGRAGRLRAALADEAADRGAGQ